MYRLLTINETLRHFTLYLFQQIIAGSNIGGSENIKEMLQFVADHPECQPLIETMPMEKINDAIEKVRNNQVRFRMVVEN